MLFASSDNPLDRVGMIASCACAIHCALMPFIIAFLPLTGLSLLADLRTEWAFVGVSIAVGLASLVPSYVRRHRRAMPLAIFAGGLCLILLARLGFEAGPLVEISIVVIGALLLAASHLLNRRLCQACVVCAGNCDREPASVAPTTFHHSETAVQRHAVELR
jgi:hypothetical protein